MTPSVLIQQIFIHSESANSSPRKIEHRCALTTEFHQGCKLGRPEFRPLTFVASLRPGPAQLDAIGAVTGKGFTFNDINRDNSKMMRNFSQPLSDINHRGLWRAVTRLNTQYRQEKCVNWPTTFHIESDQKAKAV